MAQSDPIPLQSLGPTPLSSPSLAHLPHQSTEGLSDRRSQKDQHVLTDSRVSPTPSQNGDADPESPVNYISALPPVDRGRQAWSFLVAATVLETLIWGLPYVVGIFHEFWISEMFKGQGGEATLTLAATLQTGLMYMSVAVFGPVFTAYPRWMRETQIVCLFIAGGSLIASAFVTKPWHLIITFGILYPFAGAAYLPAATLMFEWFHARRGLATGIMYAGTGAGGAIFPFVVDPLLKGVGYKATMISLGTAFIIIGHACLFFIKRRVPLPRSTDSPSERRVTSIDWSFLKRYTLYAGSGTIFVTSLGNFVPNVWLPTFAKDLNLTKPGGTGLVSILNAASVPGLTLMGYLTDRYPLFYVLCGSCVAASMSCFFLWGFGTSNVMLVMFVLVFGLLGVSITAFWSKLITIVAEDDPTLPQHIFCIFAFVRGIGNISSGPISDALLRYDVLRGRAGAYGVHNYGILLVYTGLTVLSGAFTGAFFYGK